MFATHVSAHAIRYNARMRMCEGDSDSNNNCKGNLRCFQRNGYTAVKGCNVGGDGDLSGWDYCFDPSAGAPPQCSVPLTGIKCSKCPAGYDSTPKALARPARIRFLCASVCAAPTLNVAGQSRVTQSLSLR